MYMQSVWRLHTPPNAFRHVLYKKISDGNHLVVPQLSKSYNRLIRGT